MAPAPSTSEQDEKDRKQLRPAVTPAEARRVCLSTWSEALRVGERDEVEVVELDGYDDRNFRVSVRRAAGEPAVERFVFKCHNGVESSRYPRAIDAQDKLLLHLRSRGMNVNEPQAVDAGGGATSRVVSLRVHGGGDCGVAVRLISFVEGRVMKEVEEQSEALLVAAGRYVGEMDLLLDGFDHPGMKRPHLCDTRHSLELRKFLGCVADARRRAMCESVLSRFESVVLPLASPSAAAPLRGGIIHGDANDTNLLVGADSDDAVIGVIDFSDALWSWRVCEIAVSAAYAMLRKADPVADAVSVIRGYTSVYPLLESEVTALPILVACRLVCTCVLGAYAHSQDPQNDYLLATQEPGWGALACLVETVGLDRAAERIRAVAATTAA